MRTAIAYRGRLSDGSLLLLFEDCLLDFALQFGGLARVWRSRAPQEPRRCVAGVLLELCPGLGWLSFLVSQEGALLPEHRVEQAETEALVDLPWLRIDTSHAPMIVHTVLVELLQALKSSFLPSLEVEDASGYWGHRDIERLRCYRQVCSLDASALEQVGRELELQPGWLQGRRFLRAKVRELARKVHTTVGRAVVHEKDARLPAQEDLGGLLAAGPGEQPCAWGLLGVPEPALPDLQPGFPPRRSTSRPLFALLTNLQQLVRELQPAAGSALDFLDRDLVKLGGALAEALKSTACEPHRGLRRARRLVGFAQAGLRSARRQKQISAFLARAFFTELERLGRDISDLGLHLCAQPVAAPVGCGSLR